MASAELHIKDSYYFEVPKILCPSNFHSLEEFPKVWTRLDPEFQQWEFDRLYDELSAVQQDRHPLTLLPKDVYRKAWHEWVESDHANHGKPFDVYVEEALDAQLAAWQSAPAITVNQ